MSEKRKRREYSEEFRKQMVELHNNGKPRADILREYELTGSVFDKWVRRINATGSTHDKDNRSAEEAELIRLRKQVKQLEMENDVLKQAALLFAKR